MQETVQNDNYSKFPKLKIPKQDFKTNKTALRPFLDQEIVNELKEIFDLFSDTGKVNPHEIKNGLRYVSKN
jgi:hypothetical protein